MSLHQVQPISPMMPKPSVKAVLRRKKRHQVWPLPNPPNRTRRSPSKSRMTMYRASGGHLKGRFIASGEIPVRKEIVPDKDKNACELPMYSRDLVVGSDRGIKNIVVFLTKPINAAGDPSILRFKNEPAGFTR